jgi:hypothetical protein
MNSNTSNVTNIESKQAQPACRFSINCTLSGFPATIEGEGRAGDLKIIIDRLKTIGAEPPHLSANLREGAPTKPAGAPTCPIHNSPMKASQKPGTHFCPKRNAEGSYCTHKA